MSEKSPAEEAIEILARELPGFEARAIPETDEIHVRGTLRLGAGVAVATLHDVRLRMPKYGVAAVVGRMIDETRELANRAVGLDAYVTKLVDKARAEGERKGYGDGRIAGYSEGYGAGRRAGTQAIVRAMNDE